MKDKIFKSVLEIASKHYVKVFIVFIAIAVVSSFLALTVHIDSDIMNLIPEGNEKVSAFKKVAQSFGTLDYLLILIQTADRESTLSVLDDIDRLGESLQQSPNIIFSDYKLNPALIDHYMSKGLLYLDIESLKEFEDKLSEKSISQSMKKNKAVLMSSPTSAISQLIQYDPLGFMPLFSKSLKLDNSSFKMDIMDGHYLSEDGTSLLIIVKPSKPAQNIQFSRELLNEVAGLEKSLKVQLEKIGGEIKHGGGYVIALEDSELIKKDLVVNFLFSFVAVMVLFYLCFRNLFAQLYGALPLLMGLLMTVALVSLTTGEINSATTGFSALLIGLGIDFVIVMYGRYVEERQTKGHEESISLMSLNSGKAVFIGAITTAATFYTLMISSFRGLWELGFLTATGILLCMLSIFFLLPAMLSWRHRRAEQLSKRSKFILHSFSLEKKAAKMLRFPMATIIVFFVTTALLGWQAIKIEFDNNLSNLHPKGNSGIVVQMEIEAIFGASFEHLILFIEDKNSNAVLAKLSDIEKTLSGLKKKGVISGWNSIADLIPPPDNQQKVLDYINSRKESFSFPSVKERFIRTALANGFRAEMFGDFLTSLEKLLSVESIITPHELEQTGMKEMMSRFINVGKENTRAAVYIHSPSKNIYNSIGVIDNSIATGVLTGPIIVGSELNRLMKEEARIAILIGFVAVFILLLIDFKSLWKALLSLVPVGVGLTWMFGIAHILGMKLNFMSIFVSTLIIGIAVDYGLHILHRIEEENTMEDAIIKTGRAVTIAAMTTTVGFGSTALSSYPGLRVMGILAIFGILSSLAASILLLPAIIKLFRK